MALALQPGSHLNPQILEAQVSAFSTVVFEQDDPRVRNSRLPVIASFVLLVVRDLPTLNVEGRHVAREDVFSRLLAADRYGKNVVARSLRKRICHFNVSELLRQSNSILLQRVTDKHSSMFRLEVVKIEVNDARIVALTENDEVGLVCLALVANPTIVNLGVQSLNSKIHATSVRAETGSIKISDSQNCSRETVDIVLQALAGNLSPELSGLFH